MCIYIYMIYIIYPCIYLFIQCRASQTGDAIRVSYSNVGVGVLHVPCWCRAQCDVLVIQQLVSILLHIFLSHA